METYEGVKFETVYVDRRPPVATHALDLVGWAHRFDEAGLAGGSGVAGNLSLRQDQGFLITPTNLSIRQLGPEDLVHVLEAAEKVLVVGTREPSSETRLHAALYAARPDVGAVFHGHHARIVEEGPKRGVATTPREVPYGSPELALLAAEVGREADVFVLHSHGFVAMGRDADEAGEAALALLESVR